MAGEDRSRRCCTNGSRAACWAATRSTSRPSIGGMIRDQYQGGSTVMTAISGVEIALWDLIGKACGQPVYRLLGGRCHDRIRTYANGWYGGARTPAEFAERAASRCRARLSRAQVRPVRHRLEVARARGSRPGRRDRRGGAEGGRGRRRLDDRVSRPARRRHGDRDDPPARAVRSGLVRGAGRAGVPRPAGRSEAIGAAARSPRASGSTRWRTSIG